MTNKTKNLFLSIIKNGNISKETLHGCNKYEISLIENHFSQQLPNEYKDFILIAGKGAGKLFQGTAIYYPTLLELQSSAKVLLEELNLLKLLPANALVFRMHQGYEFTFLLPGHDNPPVLQYIEGNDHCTQPWSSFSDFLEESINEHVKVWPNLN